MAWKSLMVHLELNSDNAGLLAIARDLARQCDARMIGITACQPIQILYNEGWTATDVVTQDRDEIKKEMAEAEAAFRAALTGHVRHLEWRAAITYEPLADYIACQMASADLLITGKDLGPKLFDETRRVNIGDLAMRAGRPILVVPRGVTTLPLKNVFVGWKESTEARRAVADAVPLLQVAGHCTVLEVAAPSLLSHAQARVNDVAGWLEEHGVRAEASVCTAEGLEAAHLHAALRDRKCDLLVAGAYGHNRIGEWIFGGVTQDILLDPDFCVLLSR